MRSSSNVSHAGGTQAHNDDDYSGGGTFNSDGVEASTPTLRRRRFRRRFFHYGVCGRPCPHYDDGDSAAALSLRGVGGHPCPHHDHGDFNGDTFTPGRRGSRHHDDGTFTS